MTNNTSDRYNEPIEIIQRHDTYMFDHMEIEDKTLTKIQGYGVVEKELYQKPAIMKQIDKEFIQNHRENFDDITQKKKLPNNNRISNNGTLEDYISNHGNDLTQNKKLTIANDIAHGLRQLNLEISSSISLQKEIVFLYPEVIKNQNSELTPASDIWSLSSGKLPFEGITGKTTLMNRIVKRPDMDVMCKQLAVMLQELQGEQNPDLIIGASEISQQNPENSRQKNNVSELLDENEIDQPATKSALLKETFTRKSSEKAPEKASETAPEKA
ncbi:43842_t:CDS:2 [Gigaspora margarita]|uniref:43842_t:CDS:1 n=1 Tax=Gigaspora margarita TaxID=4874 RepID=A0ABN7UIX3_GIGMA|nr:43842_t:CDS:2 [Gigaspora margarita]